MVFLAPQTIHKIRKKETFQVMKFIEFSNLWQFLDIGC